MRLTLRTLLAFEDNVFDVEQHRRLEQLLPTDQAAETTLQRIRSVVRNPMLGVPGLVDQQEELDPNYVAEYLDHQMPESVQGKFEAYCLSADKYLAEIASIHHILSNVLGEPARTSRECRLKCYDALSASQTRKPATSPSGSTKHFRPYEQQQAEFTPAKPATFWSRWLPQIAVSPQKTVSPPAPQTPMEQQKTSSLWTFTILGLCVFALWFGWQQVEQKRLARESATLSPYDTAMLPCDEGASFADHYDVAVGIEPIVSPFFLQPLDSLEPIEQVAFTMEISSPLAGALEELATEASGVSLDDPFESFSDSQSVNLPVMLGFLPQEPCTPQEENGNVPSAEEWQVAQRHDEIAPLGQNVPNSTETERTPANSDGTIIAFQPIPPVERRVEVPPEQQLPPLGTPGMSGSNPHNPLGNNPLVAESTRPEPTPVAPHRAMPQPITLTSGVNLRTLGRAVQTNYPSVIFSAAHSLDTWELPALPFDLHAGQYLLTAAPFRGTFELGNSHRIEMIGDAKLYILPPDASGVSGIFVDYGRIVIYPLQANRPLRIEMERVRGVVSVGGTESVLFVDTFAEVTDTQARARLAEGQRPQPSPILGFLPRNSERMVWQSSTQPQPLPVASQGSVVLEPGQYRFGEIRTLPNWVGPIPVSQEEMMLAEVCRRYFAEARGDGATALTRMAQDERQSVRLLGLRLWGDLGEFIVPVTKMAERREGDEAVRAVLTRYFDEVMRRDPESVQRLADAIDAARR